MIDITIEWLSNQRNINELRSYFKIRYLVILKQFFSICHPLPAKWFLIWYRYEILLTNWCLGSHRHLNFLLRMFYLWNYHNCVRDLTRLIISSGLLIRLYFDKFNCSVFLYLSHVICHFCSYDSILRIIRFNTYKSMTHINFTNNHLYLLYGY